MPTALPKVKRIYLLTLHTPNLAGGNDQLDQLTTII